jgi:hypothetical protein
MNGDSFSSGAFLPGPIWGGYGFAPAAPVSNAKPKSQSETGPQTLLRGAVSTGASAWGGTLLQLMRSMGGGGQNKYEFNAPIAHSYGTYRLMLRQPTIASLYRAKVTRLLASSWTVKSRDRSKPATKQALQLVNDIFQPQRRRILNESARYMWSGWRPFEKVWSPKNQVKYWLELKPLLPDWSVIYRDPFGTFAGLRSFPRPIADDGTMNLKVFEDAEGSLGPHKSWLVTHDGEGTNFYGTSRCDNCYETWCDWNTTRLKQIQTQAKISGSIVEIYHPQGSADIDGTPIQNQDVAQMIGERLINGGNYVTVECGPEFGTGTPGQDGMQTLWQIKITDTSGYSEGIKASQETLAYWDKLFCRGWYTPERSAIEATKAGSRADSGTAADTAVDDLEAIDDDIADQLNNGQDGVIGPVNDVLLFNRGPSEVDSVIIEPAPLVDAKRQLQKDLFIAMVQRNPAAATEAWARLDKVQTFDDLELPTDPEFDYDEFEAEQLALAQIGTTQKSSGPEKLDMPPLLRPQQKQLKPIKRERPQDKRD